MCLILFAWKTHPAYDLILAANRDEFYDRPTHVMHQWADHSKVYAGKDLTAGGTWMGVTTHGRFAALTNYRDPSNNKATAPSRGQLTKEFLVSSISPKEYLHNIQSQDLPYNGFNLLVGDTRSLWYYNNINHDLHTLRPGVYGLSNALLDDEWPKVEKGKSALINLLNKGQLASEDLLEMMYDDTKAKDSLLPKTGVSLAWERVLSPLFIQTENYGTRCSTLLIKNSEKTHIIEKTHSHIGQKEDQVEFIF